MTVLIVNFLIAAQWLFSATLQDKRHSREAISHPKAVGGV